MLNENFKAQYASKNVNHGIDFGEKISPSTSICPSCGFQLGRDLSITYGNVTINRNGEFLYYNQILKFQKRPYEIVEALVLARGCGVSRSALATKLGDEIEDATVIKYIERARSTFRAINPEFDQIVALHGFSAYRWLHRPAAESGLGH